MIYEAVLALNEDRQRAARGQLHRQIGPDQLAEALEKLEQYDDFFPTFQQLVQDLLKVLGKSAGRLELPLPPLGRGREFARWKGAVSISPYVTPSKP